MGSDLLNGRTHLASLIVQCFYYVCFARHNFNAVAVHITVSILLSSKSSLVMANSNLGKRLSTLPWLLNQHHPETELRDSTRPDSLLKSPNGNRSIFFLFSAYKFSEIWLKLAALEKLSELLSLGNIINNN